MHFCSDYFVELLSRFTNTIARGISILIIGSIMGLSAGSAVDDAAASDRWSNHPALRSFSLEGKELPSQLFLVRTRGELPATTGVVVHGADNGVFVISGNPSAIRALSQKGCAVFPMQDMPSAAPTSLRRWTPVDTPDPTVATMVAEVNWTGVRDKIQWLVDFGTRYSYAPNHFTVADNIVGIFRSYGFEPVLHPFGASMWNVEAVQTGTVYPDSFFVICGHFDSISQSSMTSAPGADDNGTGTATVLTAAEILSQHEFEYSIRYICFGGEEQGLLGSQDYAAWAAQQNMAIVGVLNFDMMGYWEPGVEMDLEIETNVASQWLAAAILNAADLYVGAPYELHVYDGAWWGDHASFWTEGYAAVNHEESWDWGDPDFNPYYHTTNDVLTHVDSVFTVGNVRIGVAALATLSRLVPTGTGVDDPIATPRLTGSLAAYPNPFNERVNLTVTGLPGRDKVRVRIYDARGRQVDAVSVVLRNGQGSTVWNVRDGSKWQIGTGVYFGKLEGITDAPPVKIVFIK